jgi:hypothetical protein
MTPSPPRLPSRTPSSAAAERATRRARYARMTHFFSTQTPYRSEVSAETHRRACEAMHIAPDHDLDIGV